MKKNKDLAHSQPSQTAVDEAAASQPESLASVAEAASPVEPTHTATGFEIMYENEDGWCDWIHPIPGYRMSCCGCGLVHEMEFQIAASNRDGLGFNPGESDEGGVIIFRAKRSPLTGGGEG